MIYINQRDNLLSLYRRTGYEFIPYQFSLCPFLHQKFLDYRVKEDINKYFDFPMRGIGIEVKPTAVPDVFYKYYNHSFAEGTHIDAWGVAHEPSSVNAYHMTRMHHPMQSFDSLEQMKEYPFPVCSIDIETLKQKADKIKHDGYAVVGCGAGSVVWEHAWGMRSMESLMMDMADDNEMARYLLDTVAQRSYQIVEALAYAGADYIILGDDVGMQHSIMMTEQMYCDWLKPYLKKTIAIAKSVKPDILIHYHSCGYIEPLIPHFIDAGVDILNPVQPECMCFEKLHAEYGDVLSFNGTIGTQTTMPFASPEEVQKIVAENIKIAGHKGGLVPCPTHLLEPDVPVENILAYIEACKKYTG